MLYGDNDALYNVLHVCRNVAYLMIATIVVYQLIIIKVVRCLYHRCSVVVSQLVPSYGSYPQRTTRNTTVNYYHIGLHFCRISFVQLTLRGSRFRTMLPLGASATGPIVNYYVLIANNKDILRSIFKPKHFKLFTSKIEYTRSITYTV